MRLTENQPRPSAARRLTSVSLSVLFGVAVCVSTLAFSLHIDAFADGRETTASPKDSVNVAPDVAAGNIITKVNPVYPPDAKKARIQGTVKLDAVISKTGQVDQLKVISGPRQLQQSSLDAVRKWTYKPTLVNGAAVEVHTSVSVIYSLSK